MTQSKLSRIEKALRRSKRDKPKIEIVWRVVGDDGRGLVRLADGTLLDEDFYYDELRKQGHKVVVVDWLSAETSKSEQNF